MQQNVELFWPYPLLKSSSNSNTGKEHLHLLIQRNSTFGCTSLLKDAMAGNKDQNQTAKGSFPRVVYTQDCVVMGLLLHFL